MQLKFKKICLITTALVYISSFLIQSNLVFFQTWAKEKNVPRVNIVAVLVDDKIYSGIEAGLTWYTSEYIQGKLADTKALVMPIDVTNIKSYDIYRMMENIYFDGLKDVNSQLIGLIIFGDIPLPVANQDGFIFPTIYPYIDFENQKYVWDETSQYFIPNGNKKGQAEVWHGLINYGTDICAYNDFFEKIQKYVDKPDEFIGDSMWYEDFIAQKEALLDDDFQYYRNRIMFGEDIGYQRYSTFMKSLFGGESANNSAEIIDDLGTELGLDFMGVSGVDDILAQGTNNTMHTTKFDQQEIETSYLAYYNEIFGKNILSTIRENIFAGGRWIKLFYDEKGKANHVVDVDNSASFIQLKDTMYLGNEDLQGMLENFNQLLEEMVDRKISINNYDMDIVIPVSYMEIKGRRLDSRCYKLVSRFDNYYFGNNARYVDKAQDLSIYRGTYRNLTGLDGVVIEEDGIEGIEIKHVLKAERNPIVSKEDPVDIKLKSIGASYGIFSSQAAGNRGYMVTPGVDRDLDIYDEEKVKKEPEKDRGLFSKVRRLSWPHSCSDEDEDELCEDLYDFAQRWWGGASPINLDDKNLTDLSKDNEERGRYKLKDYIATDAWRSIYDMGGYQSLLLGKDEGISGTGWISGDGVGPQWAATGFNAYIKYSSPTQREGWKTSFFPLVGMGYTIYENKTPDVHMKFDDMDYWKLNKSIIKKWDFAKESKSIFNVTSPKGRLLSCPVTTEGVLREQYTYKVLSSIVKHTSPTEIEINGIDKYRYGENGTLGQYYRDLKNTYTNVEDDTEEILGGLESLEEYVDEAIDFMKGKMESIDSESNNLSVIVDEIDRLEAENAQMESENTQLEAENVRLQNEINNLQNQLISAEEEDKPAISSQISSKNSQISSNNSKISTNKTKIEANNILLDAEKVKKAASVNIIKSILETMSAYVSNENANLADIYRLIMSLFVENIFSVLEYIAYIEGGNPEDFYEGNPSEIKVGFLSEWISHIEGIEDNVNKNLEKIDPIYQEVYSKIGEQKKTWDALAKKLLDIDDSYSKEVSEITSAMENIFVLSKNEDSQSNCSALKQIKIDGECGNIRKDCKAGIYEEIKNSDTEWKCKGIGGGKDVSCESIMLEDEEKESYCGDGVKDVGEQCDPGDPDKEGWLDGGCSESCNPIRLEAPSCGALPSCNGVYHGQRFSTITPSDYLCRKGSYNKFSYDGKDHKWTWECKDKQGNKVNCSATETYCGDGIRDTGEQCDPNDENKKGWGDGGCNDKCETETWCNPDYNGQRLASLEGGNHLCIAGTEYVEGNSFYNNNTHEWTWKCKNLSGEQAGYGSGIKVECMATKTYCGDGIKDEGEVCDYHDTDKEGWGMGGCNTSCEPIIEVGPSCSSSYEGQRFDNLDGGDHLCDVGSYSDFLYDEGEKKWTWKCKGKNGGDSTSGDDGSEGGEESVELPESVNGIINGETVDGVFVEGVSQRFALANSMFSWLIDVDTVGPAVIEAAKSDKDFKIWLVNQGMNFKEFTDTDWINQYADWTEGPGYDSEGAKNNHDILVGLVEHEAGMNILTPDRPIDSPRYTIMQSIAGREMKFIYPDLFKVEMYVVTGHNKSGYDIHEILTGDAIRESLEKYLHGKVDEYNNILKKECEGALEMNDYFEKLKNLGYETAIPDKKVHHCDVEFKYKEFVDALGGEKMLDSISEMLYYQSLTNERKLGTGVVEKDIEQIKKSFSVNEKRRLTLSDYLTEGNEEIKSPLFVIPMYELSGYEVAYVNSNGRDYLFPKVDDKNSDEVVGGLSFSTRGSKARSTGIIQPTDQEREYDDECKIPPSGRLPLFKLDGLSVSSPWYEGFKCWLKKTLGEPIKIRLSFESSLGDVVVSEGFGNFMESLGKSMFSETAEEFASYGDSWTKYLDAWDEIIDPKTEFDSDKVITQLQVEADKHNKEVVGSDTGVSNLLGSIYRSVKIDNSNDLLSDSNPGSELRIESSVDIGNITVEFIGTGDGCLFIDQDGPLCDGASISKTFNPKMNPLKVVITSDHKAGRVALDMKIQAGGGYIEKVIKYTVSPSFLERAEIKVGDSKTVAGMISPVKVVGYDKYDNPILWGTEKYNFTVTQGRFLKDGAYQDSFTTNDFRDLRFYYQAPLDAIDGSQSVIQIARKRDPNDYLATYVQTVIQGAPEVKLNGSVILQGKDNLETNQSYKLKSDENIYDGKTLNVSKLQRLDITMKDLMGNVIDVNSEIMVTSQNGLIFVGQTQKDDNGEDIFFETSMNYMTDGYATIYYYPNTIAGDEVINIDIPGLDTRKIYLKIYPAPTYSIQPNIKEGYVELKDTTDFEIFVSDIRGNPVDETVMVTYDKTKLKFPDLIPVSHPEDEDEWIDMAEVKDGYLKIPVYGQGAGLTEVTLEASLASTTVEFKVDDNLFPEDKLNILYLNYFGNDRGNQWGYFSDNNKYIEKLMKNSNKIIATTTQLISEDKIKRIIWKIQPRFKIWNYDNINTAMIMDGKKLNVIVGGYSSMHIPMPLLTWMTASQSEMEDILLNEGSASKNYGFFIPKNEKYIVDKHGVLYSDGVRIGSILDGEITLKLDDYSLENGDNVWKVVDRGINYGSFILHYPGFMPSDSDFDIPMEGYVVSPTFYEGTTDKMWSVGLFDLSTDFELDTSYKSIQNSDEVDERVGFLGDFKNITLFAEGEIVGEATKKFGSELLINLGDPLLSRKDLNDVVYGTDFDGGIGNEIYVDSENDIFGNYQIDFNNDGFEDLLVVYVDGTVKLAKNYGGTPDLRNMQELMHIAISFEDVFVGDVDGNKYDDIIVRTKHNQLRAYLNYGGTFDVDGSIACLNQNVFGGEISSTPSSLEGVFQIFIEDMDLDGVTDIIVYDDKGYIKVFYGGSTNGGPNYLSKEKYACDSGWYNRQASNIRVVATFGAQVTGERVFDNSMLHWVGMERPVIKITQADLPKYGIHFDPNSLDPSPRGHDIEGSIKKPTLKIMDFREYDERGLPRYQSDVDEASQQYIDEGAKYVDVTLYENELMGGGDGDNYIFAPSSFLDPDAGPDGDDGSVWKNYYVKSGGAILQDGDIVTVRVTVKANDFKPFNGSYGDIIQGPWNLYYDDYEILKGIRFISNQKNAVVKKRDGNFSYIIDNITLLPGEKLIFEYDLEYHNLPLRKIDITYDTYYSHDVLPDIKIQSVDGCDKSFGVYINGGQLRTYSYVSVPLEDIANAEYLDEDSQTPDFGMQVANIASSQIQSLPGLVQDFIGRTNLINKKGALEVSDDEKGKESLTNKLKNEILRRLQEGGLEALNLNLDIDLNIFERQTDIIEDVVDDITKGMCNGFSFGGESNCKGLPVPFNQAFLAPGKYHLFGCWELPMGPLEGGIPSFFYPGTLPTPFGPLPIPRGLKSPSDSFLWPGVGSYPSFIRIYAAPTLTAQLGIAICMSPDAVWRNIPSPISDIMGNCIVFAIKPQCNSGGDGGGNGNDLDNPNEVYPEYIEDVRDSGVCLQTQKGFMVTLRGERSTPFDLYSFSSLKKQSNSRNNFSWEDTRDTITWDNMDVNGGSNNDVEYETSWMGVIELETSSFIGTDGYFSDNTQNSIFIGDVDVLGGNYSVNKIKGGLQQGLRKLLIDKWLDPQIRYILNQLTKMHINIKFPDISNVVDNEVQTLQNISNNIGSIWENEDENDTEEEEENNKKKKGLVSYWSDITYDSMKEFNKSISNPFEALANLMNESNIINISMETINVKVPMIFKEDIDSYSLYLQMWLDRNEEILKEWESAFETFTKACSKEETPEKQQACRDKRDQDLSSFIEFKNVEWARMQNQIYANLVILQKYREFPFEIYEWIHVIDRYMSEIASLINNTIGYLSYWTSTNSERFVGYVDAIILIINIIKTYQLLIDFSIEWGENCGNCARDTYDQYSCKLSLLCDMIQLPIIQIPNFKLPNITIDLTNIDLGLDIVLPEFNFQPVRIDLPQLPDLPEVPTISVNIKLFDLPNIPLLPEPPELPELPSFIPEIEIELPILPPAPEVPKLPNKIEGIIRVAKVIGKIYCIVKGNFGLVGESSVKAKIEQLTQRTYDVDWIDTIMDFTNRSFGPVHNYGVDYEIDSYVDFQFNFSDFYDYLDTLTKSINTLTSTTVNWSNSQLNSLVNDNPLTELRDEVDGASLDVDVTVVGEGGLISKGDFSADVDGIVSDEIEYVDYEDGKNRLRDVLAYFKHEVTNTSLEDSVSSSISKIENQINRHNSIVPNEEGIERVRDTVISYLDEQKTNYDSLADLINSDYDSFLAMVESNNEEINGEGVDDNKLLTFDVQLFNLDSATKDSIKNITNSNPYKTLLDNKQSIINGYYNAINTNSADDLGLTKIQYLALRDNISSMKNRVNGLYNLMKPISSTNLIAKNGGGISNKSLLASAQLTHSTDLGARLGSQMDVASVIDPSLLSRGIYEKTSDGKFTKVIFSDSFSDDMRDTYYHTTHTKDHDIILWDKKSIYKKCQGQDCINYGGNDKKYYHSETIKEIPYEETRLDFNGGLKLKIADYREEVKNRRISNQNFDVLSFSWKRDTSDGYLIKLVERVDYSYEKTDYNPSTKQEIPHYVLVVPDTVDISEVFANNLKLELLNKKAYKIENLSGNELLQILYYNPSKDKISVGISNLDRKWYYARITALDLIDDTYKIRSPWSNQVVAGRQIVGDDQSPYGDPLLIRKATQEITSEGDDLEGYVGTRYELKINWKDNVALSYINLSKDGEILKEKYTSAPEDSVSIDIDLHTKTQKEVYTTKGIDQFGNVTEKNVTVSFNIPEITVTDVSRNPDGETVAITAELSQDIDQGNVSFQRRRGNARKSMSGRGIDADLPIGVGDRIVVGSPYSAGNEIAMFSKNGEVMALMDPNTAEIKIQTGFNNSFEVRVNIGDNSVMQVVDKSTQESLFSIIIPTIECVKFEADGYSIADLPEKGKMGEFNGGKVVYKDGENILFASKTCNLRSEYGLEGTYDYDRELDAVLLTLYQKSDLSKKYPIKVWLKVKPLLGE